MVNLNKYHKGMSIREYNERITEKSYDEIADFKKDFLSAWNSIVLRKCQEGRHPIYEMKSTLAGMTLEILSKYEISTGVKFDPTIKNNLLELVYVTSEQMQESLKRAGYSIKYMDGVRVGKVPYCQVEYRKVKRARYEYCIRCIGILNNYFNAGIKKYPYAKVKLK